MSAQLLPAITHDPTAESEECGYCLYATDIGLLSATCFEKCRVGMLESEECIRVCHDGQRSPVWCDCECPCHSTVRKVDEAMTAALNARRLAQVWTDALT